MRYYFTQVSAAEHQSSVFQIVRVVPLVLRGEVIAHSLSPPRLLDAQVRLPHVLVNVVATSLVPKFFAAWVRG